MAYSPDGQFLAVGFSPGIDVASLLSLNGAQGNAPILQAVPGNQITDGETFSINRFNQPVKTFEFDSAGGSNVAFGNVGIAFNPAGTSSKAVADAMNAALLKGLGSTVTVQQVNDRIVVSGVGTGSDPTTGLNLFAQGTSPIVNLLTTKTVVTIPTEENHDSDLVGIDVAAVINPSNVARFTVGHENDRINFAPFTDVNNRPVIDADVRGVPRWTLRAGSDTGVLKISAIGGRLLFKDLLLLRVDYRWMHLPGDLPLTLDKRLSAGLGLKF